jgi:hypothetical protein
MTTPASSRYLTVPVGPDVVAWNLLRRYGRARLPLLLQHTNTAPVAPAAAGGAGECAAADDAQCVAAPPRAAADDGGSDAAAARETTAAAQGGDDAPGGGDCAAASGAAAAALPGVLLGADWPQWRELADERVGWGPDDRLLDDAARDWRRSVEPVFVLRRL